MPQAVKTLPAEAGAAGAEYQHVGATGFEAGGGLGDRGQVIATPGDGNQRQRAPITGGPEPVQGRHNRVQCRGQGGFADPGPADILGAACFNILAVWHRAPTVVGWAKTSTLWS